MPYRRRFGRRIRRFRRRYGRRLAGRRFGRGSFRFRFGRRRFGFRRRYRRSARPGGRTRRASRSARSSGNGGSTYSKRTIRLDTDPAKYFPFPSDNSTGKYCVVWRPALNLAADVLGVDPTTKAIVAPAAYTPSANTTLLPGTLAGYLAYSLEELLEFMPTEQLNISTHYRIRRIRVRISDSRGTSVLLPGTTVAGNFGGCPEVALVNTSKSGQFASRLADNVINPQDRDDPWVILSNYKSVRNIAKFARFQNGKCRSLTMIVDPTEDYVYTEAGLRVQSESAAPVGATNGYPPSYFYSNPGTLAIDEYRVAGRRRFRWSRLYHKYLSGANLVAVLDDTKLAQGVQIMVKGGTYSAATLPYMKVETWITVEFKNTGRSFEPITVNNATTTANVYFPWTSAEGTV